MAWRVFFVCVIFHCRSGIADSPGGLSLQVGEIFRYWSGISVGASPQSSEASIDALAAGEGSLPCRVRGDFGICALFRRFAFVVGTDVLGGPFGANATAGFQVMNLALPNVMSLAQPSVMGSAEPSVMI